MSGVLLDTHAFYWLVSGRVALADDALIAIGENRAARSLYVSSISAWELSVATQKSPAARPDLGGAPPRNWFREAMAITNARIAPIRQRIALEAAEVAMQIGHKDPGDCFLIATARVKRIPIVTRDARMQRLARERPHYLSAITC